MPIVQISRIQHRRGKRTDLPQLAAGELGWVIDEQRLYIGNGTVADGAPAVGNTEIITSGSSAFTTALSHTYKGYQGDSTPITTTVQRTLQQRLDDYEFVNFGYRDNLKYLKRFLRLVEGRRSGRNPLRVELTKKS